jgi:hypothetical protein
MLLLIKGMQRTEFIDVEIVLVVDGRLFSAVFRVSRQKRVFHDESVSVRYMHSWRSVWKYNVYVYTVVAGEIPCSSVACGSLAGETGASECFDVQSAVESCCGTLTCKI